MNAKRKRKALKVYYQYRYQPLTFFLGFIMFWGAFTLLCSLVFAPLANATGNIHSYWIVYLILAPITLAVAASIGSSVHLSTHEDALEYHTIFKRIIVPWKHLSFLEVIETVNEEGGTSYKHYLWLKDHDLDMLDIGSIIHIEDKRNKAGCFINVDALLATPFGQDLLHYAPHVIEKTRNKQALDEELYAEFEAQKVEYEQRTRRARNLSRADQPVHVYPLFRHRPFEFLTLALFYSFTPSIGIGLWLGFINAQLNLFIPPAIIILFAAAIGMVLGFWFESRTALTVYETGLQYRVTLHLNVFVKWSELTHFDVMSFHPEDSNTVNLYLRNSSIAPINVEKFVPIKRHIFRGEGVRPIIDVAHLLSTSFGQDLLRYAPHVIEATRNEEYFDEIQ
jgi:hypothetical protein